MLVMALKMHCSCFLVTIQICIWSIVGGQHMNSYRAAVLEYAPHTEGATLLDNWNYNLGEYLKYIQDASNQRAQIIVLPELGLSGWPIVSSNIDSCSSEIPEPHLRISPCTVYNNNNYSLTIRELSCAARNHQIYVVANLIERSTHHGGGKIIYYNTNVVFNRNGEVVARHRKIHLFKEPYFTNGNELTSFTTDFGVTFAVFICSDVLYKRPSQEVLVERNATDVIFSTAWFNTLPFYQPLGLQHAYAKSNGVNLLAAGLNSPRDTIGGSGIYFADGRIAETFISGSKLSKLIIQDVPKISTRTPNSSCRFQKSSGSYKWGVDPFSGNTSALYANKQDLHDYTFKSLNLLGYRKLTETICSSTSTFCCTFNISISRTNNIPPNYIYKLAAFQGSIQSQEGVTLGARHCAIVACTGENSDSCGDRNAVAPRGIRFEEISVTATLDNKDVHYQPYTVTYDLKPVTDYTFCAEEITNDKVEVSMTTTDSIDSLLVFGLTGRVFSYDQHPAGLINSSNQNSITMSFVLVVALITCVFYR